MKQICIVAIGIVLMAAFVSAHAIEKGPVTQDTDQYAITFSTEPKFPVTGKETHFDFVFTDKEGSTVSGLNITLEIHKEATIITLELQEEQEGHYDTVYNFEQEGSYELHFIINNEELEIEFGVDIDTFGRSGLLRSGTIIIFLFILIALVYKDCRRTKNG